MNDTLESGTAAAPLKQPENRAPQVTTAPSAAVPLPKLLPGERVEFAAVKLTIKRGFEAMAAMGEALARARQKELYREEFGTFAAFCEDFCGFDVRYAQRLMVFAEIMGVLALPDSADAAPGPRYLLPQGERHARPLGSLPQGQWRPVWAEAVRTAPDGQPTVKHVEKVVREFKARMGLIEPEPEKAVVVADAALAVVGVETAVAGPAGEVEKPKGPVIDVREVGDREARRLVLVRRAIGLLDEFGTTDSAIAGNVRSMLENLENEVLRCRKFKTLRMEAAA